MLKGTGSLRKIEKRQTLECAAFVYLLYLSPSVADAPMVTFRLFRGLRVLDNSSGKFQCAISQKLRTHYLRALTFLVSREILREAFFL